MNNRSFIGIIALLVLILIGANSLYIVNEKEKAVLLKFGELVETDIQPGLHFKVPLADDVKRFDGRILTVDAPEERYLTKDQKYVIVDSFAKWRIIDVEPYYKTTQGDEHRAAMLLSQRINTGLRNQFGERSKHEVISGERDSLMTELSKQLNGITTKEFGIEIVDIRVKKIELPIEVSNSVFERMNTERHRQAREYRAEGNEIAAKIRAGALKQKVEIESGAYREAEKMRGEGDAEAASIYAAAFNKDPEFYAFARSLKAYTETFKNKGDIMLIDPDSDFFKYLKESEGSKKR